MMFSKKSDVHCLVCDAQFSESDVEIMDADGVLPICDSCIEDICTFKVQYDGSRDLLEFLTQEVKGSKCPSCLKMELELNSIRYGSPVWGNARCGDCEQGWSLQIHIEFV